MAVLTEPERNDGHFRRLQRKLQKKKKKKNCFLTYGRDAGVYFDTRALAIVL